MNTEARTPSRFAKAGSDTEPSTAMEASINDLLVRSMPVFNYYMDAFERSINARFGATEHRPSAFENRMKTFRRIEYIALICLIATLWLGFAGLIYALLR